jgi:hypothetical protein
MERIRWFACLFALAGLAPGPAAAHGALAIGLPSNVAKDGVAIGFSYNYESRDTAEARALKECLSFMDAPPSTRALCKVIESFSRQCVAIALDPDAGTPGVGWAIAAALQSAEGSAMERCRDTAGANRRAFCKLMMGHCDTKP